MKDYNDIVGKNFGSYNVLNIDSITKDSKNKNVVKTLNAFYYGLIEICDNELENSSTNAESSRLEFILLTAQKAADDNLSSVLWKYNCFKEKYVECKDSTTSSFTNNGI